MPKRILAETAKQWTPPEAVRQTNNNCEYERVATIAIPIALIAEASGAANFQSKLNEIYEANNLKASTVPITHVEVVKMATWLHKRGDEKADRESVKKRRR